MKKYLLMLMTSAALGIILSACGSSEAKSGAESDGEKMTIEHEIGETIVEKNHGNVVVFNYGALDTLDALSVEVAGVAKSSLPPYLSKYEDNSYANIGSLKEPDFEKIHEMDPGLIIISGRQSDAYEDLKEIAPTLYVGT